MALPRKQLLLGFGSVALIGLVSGTIVLATPGSGVTVLPVMVGHYGALDIKPQQDAKLGPHDKRWDMLLKTKDLTIVSSDLLTVAANGTTGWHSHAGPVFGTVLAGSIVITQAVPGCPSTTYTAGQSFIEPDNVPHRVSNPSGSVVAQYAGVQIRPEGAAGRIDEPAPENCS